MNPALIAALEQIFAGESAASMSGTANALGVGSGGAFNQFLAQFAKPGGVQGLDGAQGLGGGLKHIEDLKQRMEQAVAAIESSRAHSESVVSGYEDPKSFYHSKELANQERSRQAESEQKHQESLRSMQQQVVETQARVAVTLNPKAAGGLAQVANAGRLGAGAGAFQLAGSLAQRAIQPAANLTAFAGGQAGQIAGEMVNAPIQAASNIGSSAMSGASLGMMAGGPAGAAVGAAAGALSASSKELAMLPKRIVDWSESLVSSQKAISRFSGPMSQAFAQRDLAQTRRDIASAQATGGSTAELTKSLDQIYDVVRPLKDSITIVLANELSVLVRTLEAMTPIMAAGVGAMAALADFFTAGTMGFTQQLTIAMGKVMAEEAARGLNRQQAGNDAAGAIQRLRGEDPKKPRQVARR